MSEPDDEHPDGGAESQAPPETVAEPVQPAPPTLREDHLQNAVAFLSHPKVRSSGAAAKREFLERKGLIEAEIEEAFRRVPQQPPSAPSVPSAAGTTSGAATAAAPSAVQSTLAHLQPQAQQGPPQQQPMYGQQPQMQQQGPGYGPGAMVVAGPQHMQQQQGVRWTQAVLGAGFLAASAYAAKSLVWPYMEGAYHNWRGHVRPPPRPTLTDGDAAATVQATQAMAEAIAAQTAELRTSIDSIRQLVTALEASQKAALASGPAASGAAAAAAADGLTVSDLRQELRSFAETLQELASPTASPAPAASAGGARLESELGEIKGLLAELLRSPRSSGSHSPSRLPQPQGGKAAGVGDEAGTPVSAHSTLAQHRLADAGSSATAAPRPGAAAEVGEHSPLPAAAANGIGQGHLQAAANGAAAAQEEEEKGQAGQQTPQRSQQTEEAAAVGGETPNAPPHPASYMEVLEMLEKGQTPPGIRTDINDKPPNPYATPAAPKLKPRPKPWEKGSAGSSIAGSQAGGAGGSGSSLASLGAGSAPAAPTPAAAWDHEAMPAVGAAPAAGTQQPAEAAAAELIAQQGLSPVRAPSAEQAAAELAAEAADVEAAQGQQQGQQGQQVGRALSGMSSFHSPKRATSIFDAVAPPPDSPHIIAGRLSPARPDGMARTGSGGSATGAPAGSQAGDSSLLGGGGAGSQPGGSNNFNSLLAAAQERASSGAGSVMGMLGGSGEGATVLEGSGIGRPISRNWRPPPIPAPTLSGGGSSGLASAFSAPAAASGAEPNSGAAGAASSGVAAHPGAGSGLANGQRAVSTASLGDDFASA